MRFAHSAYFPAAVSGSMLAEAYGHALFAMVCGAVRNLA
jgi:hypothetical protein